MLLVPQKSHLGAAIEKGHENAETQIVVDKEQGDQIGPIFASRVLILSSFLTKEVAQLFWLLLFSQKIVM
jgi:hypothetical protein